MDTSTNNPSVLLASSTLSVGGSTVTAISYHASTIDPNQLALWVTITSGCVTITFTVGAMLIGLLHFIQTHWKGKK